MIERPVTLVALDIETTGLDPGVNSVVAVGVVSDQSERVLVRRPEAEMLVDLEGMVSGFALDTVLVTWNGEEFDLPFLAKRFEATDVHTSLNLWPRHQVGKYGKPLYAARWGGVRHFDIAPLFKELAAARNVAWKLKPVARELLGVEPVEVDRRGEAIARLEVETLTRYVLSDARITFWLAKRYSEFTGQESILVKVLG